jgi:hypothetical protein
MQSDKYPQPYSQPPTRNFSPGRADNYVQSYTSRQTRFDARADRRFNDWFLFGIPTPLLWLEGACQADVDCVIPLGGEVVIDLWP